MADTTDHPRSTTPSDPGDPPLFSVRTALILLIAIGAAGTIGGLTYLQLSNGAGALVAAIAAFGATIALAHKLIG